MLKSYFLTALRSLNRNKNYTLLNIVGLALGITCSLLIFLVISFELSFDTFHSKADRIYRVTTNHVTPDGDKDKYTGSRFPLAKIFRQHGNLGFENITQIFVEEGAQIGTTNARGQVQNLYREEGAIAFTEPGFFDLFDFEIGSVDPRSGLAKPNNVVLTQSIADKYFPETNPIGKKIKFNNLLTLNVTSVIPDIPANSDFPFIMLISYATYRDYTELPVDVFDVLTTNQNLFVLLPEEASPAQKTVEINQLLNKFRPKEIKDSDYNELQPLRDIHFNASYGNYNNRTVSKERIWAMAFIGLFMILVACINFVNLATAQAIKRAKEVGIRKVLGSSKRHLILQFIGETLIITLVATLLSVVLSELILPYLINLLGLKITFNIFQNPSLLGFLILLVLLVTLSAGLYPAFIIARFEPIAALKSKISTQQVAGLSLRRTLVVIQFTICQVLIICTILVNEQMDFLRTKSLGFDKDSVLTVMLPNQASSKMLPFREELLSNPVIREVSFATTPPSSHMTWSSTFTFENADEFAPFQANMKYGDEHFLSLFNFELVAGRAYTASDTASVIINETMYRKLGLKNAEEALGKQISLRDGNINATIVGVVKDFHQKPLTEAIDPTIIVGNPKNYIYMLAKIDITKHAEAIEHIGQIWNKVYPNDVFNHELLDKTIINFYQDEARQTMLFKIFSLIAILIGCLGLYGLVAFMAAQRTKEVSIRKVLGASVFDVVLLFSKEFIKLVLIAFVIAVPFAYYLISKWLDNFAFKITLDYWPFILAGIITLFIALITMSIKAVNAALVNPVISLKSE